MEIWMAAGEAEQGGYSCAFLGAYATEEEAWAAIKDEECQCMFPWELGKPHDGYISDGPEVRWCEKVVEDRRRQAEWEAERLRKAAEPVPEVEFEVVNNPDGTTTVRIKQEG